MTAIEYRIGSSYSATVTSGLTELKKVVSCDLAINQHRVTVFFSLIELSEIVTVKRYNKLNALAELKHLVIAILRLLSMRSQCAIQLTGLKIVSSQQAQAKINMSTDDNLTLCVAYLADAEDVTIIEQCLTKLHQAYMRSYSSIFNAKMEFPIILATSWIGRDTLKDLTLGNIIMFDNINLPMQTVKCVMNNVQLDLVTIQRIKDQ